MITPGLAFAIAYEPYRFSVVPATGELLARLARNPSVMSNAKLKHAVEFATRGAKIEATIATEKANALIARANAKGAGLPELPAAVLQWRAWLDDVATHVKPLLPGTDGALAFEAGTAAAALMVAWARAEKLAYLRAADPEQPDLTVEAVRNGAAIPALTHTVEHTLARVQRPLVAQTLVWLRRSFGWAPRPDATSSKTFSSGYAEITHWRQKMDDSLLGLPSDFDVPLDPKPTSEPSPEEQRLFTKILEHPDDNESRCRYAELAACRLDPRAELIREQFAILELDARGEMLHGKHPERVQQLLVSHPEWTADLIELGARDVKLSRGFPDEITIDIDPFLENVHELFVRAPITCVRLRGGLAGRVPSVARLSHLAKLTALDLYEQGVTDDDIAALAASPYVSGLRFLNLGRNRLTNAGIEILVASKNLPALERVSLEFNPGADPVDELEYYDYACPGVGIERSQHGACDWSGI